MRIVKISRSQFLAILTALDVQCLANAMARLARHIPKSRMTNIEEAEERANQVAINRLAKRFGLAARSKRRVKV